jgi:dihydrolipoamide dehydrogenase
VTGDDGEVTTRPGRHVVLATGSVPRRCPGVEVDGEVVQTSDQALWFTTAPERAVIIGAGAIGMEFASMWRADRHRGDRRRGARPRPAARGRRLSRLLERAFKKRGASTC